MSAIAAHARIGRATLYKYFRSFDAILQAWHDRHVAGHLHRLTDLRNGAGSASQRLASILGAYALILHESAAAHDLDLIASLHRGKHMARHQRMLRRLVGDLIAEGARTGDVRSDIDASELTAYCLGALSGAATVESKAAAQRIAVVVMDGLRPS